MTIAAPAPSRLRGWRGTALVFAGMFLAYLVAAWWLNVHVGYIFTDSLSRVASVSGVLLSRDPHLAAIGFIFTPLTALLQLPLGALGHWWPGLLRWNLTAAVVSAAFMAGAVVQIRGIARDRGLSAATVLVLTALFALNPMIVLYAANGMSEAPFVFFILWTVRRLMRWMRSDDVHDLIAAGIALALAYLTRYDALGAMAVAAGFVAIVSWRRSGGHSHGRRWAATSDAMLVLAPGAAAFLAWSVTSWLITGSAFQQFSSVYGNSAIVEQSGAPTGSPLTRMMFSLTEIAVLAPALPVLLILAGVLAYRRRDSAVLVPVVLFGSVLGTQGLLYMVGSTFPLLRFYIVAIPLAFVLTILIAQDRGLGATRRPGESASPREPATTAWAGPSIALVVSICMLVGSTAVTVVAMGNARLAALEYPLASVVVPGRSLPAEEAILRTFGAERRIADYLDAMRLPEGSVLLDTVESYGVVASSANPKQFVVTSDTDFVRILNDPARYGVKYILTVPNSGRGVSDAVNRRYPTMFEDGAGGIGALELEIYNDGGSEPTLWRLYAVTGNK